MDINNRELATLTIIIFALSYALYKDEDRGIINQTKLLLRTLFAKPIFITILLFTLYISLEVILLAKIGYWELYLLKDTIIWSLTAFALILNHRAIVAKDNFLKKIIMDNIKILTIFQFIVNFYSFNYIVELCVVTLATLIVGMQAAVKLGPSKEGSELNEKVLNTTLSILGGFLLYFTINELLDNPTHFFLVSTLKSFLLPVLLIILYIPFYYLIIIYSKYELINATVDRLIKDTTLSKYLKKLIFKKSLLRYSKLKTIHPQIYLFNYLSTKQEFNKKINELLQGK
ncbi:hypothetical protein CRV01_06235 [Arcobacter sp. CECT 8983]|uniref:hypothetical protein n=1 Tax=Arcobacter sp. CECT 8983 TaxID=2044508 RepID=UPI00100BBB46|nr:hypothetical protein [Arcobacter sp. CECT 8983]RXJ90745.1 hypothetical protein CRV01_06235 [Arcobacter sp. CECT 8983]